MYAITGSKNAAAQAQAGSSWLMSFLSWSEKQNKNRLSWLAIALTSHGCVITPFTVMTVMATTQSLSMFMIALFAMTLALVTNLAALPTKITIPSFLASIVIDLVIVVVSLVSVL